MDDSFDTGADDTLSPRGYFEHELRTPLAAIRAAAEILQDNPDMSYAERETFTRVVLSESARLSQRVSEIVNQIDE